MAKYSELAKEILEKVGGTENVTTFVHCQTRLRFALKDMNIPNQEEIKEIKGVLGVVVSAGQFQIVIGNHVGQVYEEICSIGGFTAQEAIQENLDAPKEKLTLKSAASSALDYMASVVATTIPIILTASLFKTFYSLFGPDVLGWISAESNLAILFDFVYDAGFYFLPIYIAYAAAKKLNTNYIVAMFLGGILLAPDFMALASSGTAFSVFGIPASAAAYNGTIIPMVLTVWAMSYVYKFFSKRLPGVLQTVFTPFLTILVMLPLMLCVFAPLGNLIGAGIATVLNALYNISSTLAIGVVSALFPALISVGMHGPIGTVGAATFFSTGVDNFVVLATFTSNFAIFGMGIGALLRMKNKDERSLNIGYLTTFLLGGVTEPLLYGIALKYKRPFIGATVGAFAGGLVAGFFKVSMYALAPNYLFPVIFVAGGTSNMIMGVISIVVSVVVAAAVTYVVGFEKKK